MKLLSNDRNGTSIFAERSMKNLNFIVECEAAGADVHPVTQAVSALVGIIVFPWETAAFDTLKGYQLSSLYAKGWPRWNMTGTRRMVALGHLIEVLRNAASHGGIELDSDSPKPSEVTISFKNTSHKSDDCVS
jgi:hypothetical protein